MPFGEIFKRERRPVQVEEFDSCGFGGSSVGMERVTDKAARLGFGFYQFDQTIDDQRCWFTRSDIGRGDDKIEMVGNAQLFEHAVKA